MAADLTADLEEAEAEGTPAEAVLGTGAFNARATMSRNDSGTGTDTVGSILLLAWLWSASYAT
jgi:hypothetical protein